MLWRTKMMAGIRHRLLTIVILGVVTSALSVVSLVQLLTTNTSQRIERARDALTEEVDRVSKNPGELGEQHPVQLVGMRAGIWSDRALGHEWSELAQGTVEASRAAHGRIIRESAIGEITILAAAAPIANDEDHVVYAVYAVRPLASLRTWRSIVILLAAATALLVAAALYSVVTVGRGASALRKSLDALASDLGAPVPHTSVRELDGIGEGISGLAKKLAEARAKEERITRELADNERLAALGRVVAGVAHEVRNPLASIKLRLDLAAASADLPTTVLSGIAHATSEIDRLDRLVRDLLFVSGRSVGPKGNVDFAALVKERVEALAPWTREHGVTVECSGSGRAAIDSDAMARAIDNLLRNAVEASPKGGRVDARLVSSGDRVTLDVDDRGEGVAADRVTELFEPFFSTKPSGTGLGLAISRAIARAHGGDVTYERTGGVSTFSLAIAALAKSEKAAA